MSPFNHSYFIFFIAFSCSYISICTFAAPISNPYDSFIEYLTKSNCSMPSTIKLPFEEPAAEAPFGYLSDPLKECKTPDALKDSDEAKSLCNEIFEVLQNITCVEYKTPLPEIQSEPLSENVCKDFKATQIVFPRKDDYLSWRLMDSKVCKFFCSPVRYHLLCETLLWSHDLQVKIKSALRNAEGATDLNIGDSSKMGSSSIKIKLTSSETESNKKESNEGGKTDDAVNGNVQSAEIKKAEEKELSNLNNLELASNEKTSEVQTAVKHDISTTTKNNNKENNLKVVNITEALTGKNESKPNKEDSLAGKSNVNLLSDSKNHEQNKLTAGLEPESKLSSDNPVNSHPETIAVEASNNVDPVSEDPDNAKSSDIIQQPVAENQEIENNPLQSSNVDILAPKISTINENKIQESNLENSAKDKQKSISNATKSSGTDVSTKLNEKFDKSVPQDTEMDNELNNVNLNGQENESKVKTPNLKTVDDDERTDKPKLTDFESPIGGGSETVAKPTESTTVELVPDKEEDEHQEEKEQDQYNDTENEAEYAKSEYDNPPLKNKDVDIKSPDIDSPNEIPSNYFIRSRNNIGRMPDEGPIISSFPDQEDSHFFFYFLSMVLILMAGYLIFHNKQKIIALIVEGRHERRRRSHGSGYKKLETK